MCADQPFVKKGFTEIVDSVLDLKSGQGGLSDAREGSVMRTLIEAFARELAVCYEQLDFVYRCAYLETATGAALDNVVALLGIQRRRAGNLEGTAVFRRNEPAADDIHIPAGTEVAGRDATRVFATIEPVTLAKGERLVTVAIRATEPGNEGDDASLATGVLTLMPRPIAGIEDVTNPSRLVLRQHEETDDELRERARIAVRGSNAGTVSAIEQAVRAVGISEVQVVESVGGIPGEIKVVVGDAEVPEALMQRVRDAVEEVRPAGVWTEAKAAQQVLVEITATLELKPGLSQADKDAIRSALEARLADHVAALRIGEPVRLTKIESVLANHDAVIAVHATAQGPVLAAYAIEDGNAVPMGFRYQLSSGDIQVGPFERVTLDRDRLPIRISFEADRLPVHIDLAVTIDARNVTDEQDGQRIEQQITETLKDLLSDKAGQVRKDASAELSYQELLTAIAKPLRFDDGLRARITLLHQRNGLVKELQTGEKDTLAEREEPILRTLTVTPAPAS